MDERKNPYGQDTARYPQPTGVSRVQQPYDQPYQQPYMPPQQSMQTPMLSTTPQPYQPAKLHSTLEQAQILTPAGFQPLSKEERAEAARIAMEAQFSFDGYQVVRREFFSHKFDPTLTIRGNSIIFNNACISKLDQVVYVQVLINPADEKLVIRPCGEGARDAIRWCIAKEEKRKSRQISCGLFTEKLYKMMGWETLYRYKLQGSRISYLNEELYIFDLTSTEVYLPPVTDSADPIAKPKRRAPQYPATWSESFGLTVDDHTASTRINLMEGYGLVDVSEKPEQMPMEMLDRETGEVTKV